MPGGAIEAHHKDFRLFKDCHRPHIEHSVQLRSLHHLATRLSGGGIRHPSGWILSMNHFLEFEEDEYNSNASPYERTAEIFQAKEGKPQLEVCRFYAANNPAKDGNSMAFKPEIELRSSSDITALKNVCLPLEVLSFCEADPEVEADDHLQIFTVRQQRSWTTLDISHELFTSFTTALKVFPSFWKCVRMFGIKCDEHECEFPGFQSQRTSPLCGHEAFGLSSVSIALSLS